MTRQFLVGVGMGVLGLVATSFRPRKLDWGLALSLVAGLALLAAAPGWTTGLRQIRSGWTLVIAGIAVPAIAAGLVQRSKSFVTPWLFVASLLAAWATVPDTESIAVLLGAAFAMGFAFWPLRWSLPGWTGGFSVGALSVMVVLHGGRGRPNSVIGALGALALIGLPAVARPTTPTLVLAAQHLGLCAWWARVAGRAQSAVTALWVGLAMTLAAFGLTWWLFGRRGRPVSGGPNTPE